VQQVDHEEEVEEIADETEEGSQGAQVQGVVEVRVQGQGSQDRQLNVSEGSMSLVIDEDEVEAIDVIYEMYG
jgi:hypothetical protein